MTTYAIGDVQGCYDSLRRLLDKIQFDPNKDQLWFAGDLINRGPKSLETLRFIISLGDSAHSVLGNHECHFLASARGHKKAHRTDTFADILEAHDADQLIHWVRSLPFLHHDKTLGYTMIHAGLPAPWTLEDAKRYAKELEAAFQNDLFDPFLASMYGNKPTHWDNSLSGHARLRFIINCFTRMRFCDEQGHLEFKEKGSPADSPPHLIPWFEVPKRQTAQEKIVFGHWSTLGLNKQNNAFCLDSGCLWGGQLSAMTLDGTERIISLDCDASLEPY
jgi:bis(5'-nucleosyl)-tetraphosphatase (symmetrical)